MSEAVASQAIPPTTGNMQELYSSCRTAQETWNPFPSSTHLFHSAAFALRSSFVPSWGTSTPLGSIAGPGAALWAANLGSTVSLMGMVVNCFSPEDCWLLGPIGVSGSRLSLGLLTGFFGFPEWDS
jgi:hypothetical protein